MTKEELQEAIDRLKSFDGKYIPSLDELTKLFNQVQEQKRDSLIRREYV